MPERRKYRINWFKLTILILFGYFLYIFVSQQLQLHSINREAEAARKEFEQLDQQNKLLLEEKARLADPAYVEKLAREELGLVKPGEMPYIPAEKN